MRVYVVLVVFFSFISWSYPHVIHYTSSGGICTNTCGYHDYKYTWCEKKGGSKSNWDYCSLEEGLAISGEKCATACDFWGGSNRYCYFKNGKWNYCSLVSEWESFEYSLENNLCKNSCRIYGTRFQCETVYGLEPCSPFQDVTPTGLPCHKNYQCAKYGCSSYRCHTGKRECEWDLCKPNDKNECIWNVSTTNSSQNEICTLFYAQNKSKIFLRRERQMKALHPTKEQFKDAVHFIDNISSITNIPNSDALSKMYFFKESILCKGINYTNMELLLETTSSLNKPIAHVIFSEILSMVEVLRLAFYTSLHSSFYFPAYTIVVSVDEPMLCSIHY